MENNHCDIYILGISLKWIQLVFSLTVTNDCAGLTKAQSLIIRILWSSYTQASKWRKILSKGWEEGNSTTIVLCQCFEEHIRFGVSNILTKIVLKIVFGAAGLVWVRKSHLFPETSVFLISLIENPGVLVSRTKGYDVFITGSRIQTEIEESVTLSWHQKLLRDASFGRAPEAQTHSLLGDF